MFNHTKLVTPQQVRKIGSDYFILKSPDEYGSHIRQARLLVDGVLVNASIISHAKYMYLVGLCNLAGGQAIQKDLTPYEFKFIEFILDKPGQYSQYRMPSRQKPLPVHTQAYLPNELLMKTPASSIELITQKMYECLVKTISDVMETADSNDLSDIINRLPQQTKHEYYDLLMQTAIGNLMNNKDKTARNKNEVADLINKEINMKG